MTVALISRPKSFVGLAADTKPASPPAGSDFYETDSGLKSIYDGAGWQPMIASPGRIHIPRARLWTRSAGTDFWVNFGPTFDGIAADELLTNYGWTLTSV